MNSVIGLRFAYICSNCEKLLGISKELISIPLQGKEFRCFTQIESLINQYFPE